MGAMSQAQCRPTDARNECPLPWNGCNDHVCNVRAVMTRTTKWAQCPMVTGHRSYTAGTHLHQTGAAPQWPPQRLDSATPHLPTSATSNTTSAQRPPHQHEAQPHWRDVRHVLPSQQAHATTRSAHRHEAQWFPTVGPSHPSRRDAECLTPNAPSRGTTETRRPCPLGIYTIYHFFILPLLHPNKLCSF